MQTVDAPFEQDNLEERYNSIAGEIEARFTTKLSPKFRIFDGKMNISTDMDQNKLELLVKNLLIHNNDPHKPQANSFTEESLLNMHFEFSIAGELLRGNLRSHILGYNISSEDVLEIEYFIALASPEEKDKIQEEDWIACVCHYTSSDSSQGFVVGLFNGHVSAYSAANKLVWRQPVSAEPIKTLKLVPGISEGSHHLLSAGLDEVVRLHLIREDQKSKNNQEILHLANYSGFNNPILALDASPLFDGLFCAAGADKKLGIWRILQDVESKAEQPVKKNKHGKIVKTQATIKEFAPEGMCEELHEDDINSVCWFSNEEIYTGSADHSIKIVDVQRMEPVSCLKTRDSVNTSIDGRHANILSAHEDGYVRLWDKRTEACVKTFKSHTRYASCVKYSNSANIFASCSYDGTVKIWDTRSVYPLETLDCHQDKVFSLIWKDKKQIISVGSDSQIVVHSLEPTAHS